jgi:hypothetical protein
MHRLPNDSRGTRRMVWIQKSFPSSQSIELDNLIFAYRLHLLFLQPLGFCHLLL